MLLLMLMCVNESEILIAKRNKERTKMLLTIPSSHLRNKNSMGRNYMKKELNGGPKKIKNSMGEIA